MIIGLSRLIDIIVSLNRRFSSGANREKTEAKVCICRPFFII